MRTICQVEETSYKKTPILYEAPYMRPHEMQSRMVVAMGWEERGLSISCGQFPVSQDESSGDGCW